MRKLTLLVLVAVALAVVACATPTSAPVPPTTAPVPTSAPVATSVPAATAAAPKPTAAPTVAPTTAAVPATKTKVKLTLNYLAGGPQAGFAYAKKLGYYDAVGIDLTIEEGKGSATTAQQIATGQTDFGFSDGPSVMQVRSKGGDIRIVAPILQTNGFAIISLKDKNITKPADLVGKKLAVQPGSAQTVLLDPILAANKIDPKSLNIVNIDPAALIGSLLQGQVDAILAGADSQSISIRDQGFQINEIYYRDVGVPTIGLSIATTDAMIKKDPVLVKNFVSASLKGWDAARKNPDAAAQAITDMFLAGNKDANLKQLNVDLALLCAKGAKTLGAPPTDNWNVTYDLLTQYMGLPKDKPITDYYTTDFIPADAPPCP